MTKDDGDLLVAEAEGAEDAGAAMPKVVRPEQLPYAVAKVEAVGLRLDRPERVPTSWLQGVTETLRLGFTHTVLRRRGAGSA
jgi:hypothetical protein